MINQAPKRSNEPVFWGLFGAGGTWGAIFTPVMIVLVCLVFPFASPDTIIKMAMVASSIWGKLFLLLMIILPIWCSFHRMHHTAHDLKWHIPGGSVTFYGAASVLSVIALIAIISM